MLNPLPPIMLAPSSNRPRQTPARVHAVRSRARNCLRDAHCCHDTHCRALFPWCGNAQHGPEKPLHMIMAKDTRGEVAGPARRNPGRRPGGGPDRSRRCQILGGGSVGRAGRGAANHVSTLLVLYAHPRVWVCLYRVRLFAGNFV